MKLKSNMIAGILAVSLAVPVFANDEPDATPLAQITTTTTLQPEFTVAETQTLFEQDAKPVQLATLSQQEMKETEGAFGNFAFGAAMGALSYGVTSAYTRSWSWGSFATHVAIGAASSGFSSLTAVRAVWGFNKAVAVGAGRGVYSYSRGSRRGRY